MSEFEKLEITIDSRSTPPPPPGRLDQIHERVDEVLEELERQCGGEDAMSRLIRRWRAGLDIRVFFERRIGGESNLQQRMQALHQVVLNAMSRANRYIHRELELIRAGRLPVSLRLPRGSLC